MVWTYEVYILVEKRFHSFAALTHETLFPLEDKLHIFVPPCNILYLSNSLLRANMFHALTIFSYTNISISQAICHLTIPHQELTLYLFIHSFFVLPGTTSAILSHLSGVFVGNFRRAPSRSLNKTIWWMVISNPS